MRCLIIVSLWCIAFAGQCAGLNDYVHSSGPSELISPFGFKLFQSKAHGRYLMSLDSRYIVRGNFQLIDRFTGNVVSSPSQLKADKNYVDLQRIGIDPEKISAATIGQKAAPLFSVFLDPTTSKGQRVLKSVEKVTTEGRARVAIFVVPGSKEKARTVSYVFCQLRKSPTKALAVLASGGGASMPPCKVASDYVKAVVLTPILGFSKLPGVIAPNGRTYFGDSVPLLQTLVSQE